MIPVIKEYQYKKHTIRIIEDDVSDESPREYDPLGIIVSFHKNYDWNDSDAPKLSAKDFSSLEEIKEHLIKQEGAVVILPVYMLDHSGQQFSTKPFDCPFDSGQLGFIYTTREKYLKHRNFKRLTKKLKDEAELTLQAEIEDLDQWNRGEAYGFVIDPQGEDDWSGLHDEYGSAYYDVEEAEIVARDSVDRLQAFDEEQEFIKNLPIEELPKYINHEWKYPYASDEAYKNRLKELENAARSN